MVVRARAESAMRLGLLGRSSGLREVEEALLVFVGDDPDRSAAVASLRGPRVRAEIGASAVRPGASLLKLPLAAAVHSAAHAGDLDLQTTVARKELPTTVFPSVLAAFAPNRRFTIAELCSLCLIASDNPAADYLLGLVGFDATNRAAVALGARSTILRVGFGDAFLGEAGRGNVTTAADALAMIRTLVLDPLHGDIAVALHNNLSNVRIPLLLDHVRAPHKSGSLRGIANDAGVLFGRRATVAVAFLSERQPDSVATSVAIGDCVARIWRALGE